MGAGASSQKQQAATTVAVVQAAVTLKSDAAKAQQQPPQQQPAASSAPASAPVAQVSAPAPQASASQQSPVNADLLAQQRYEEELRIYEEQKKQWEEQQRQLQLAQEQEKQQQSANASKQAAVSSSQPIPVPVSAPSAAPAPVPKAESPSPARAVRFDDNSASNASLSSNANVDQQRSVISPSAPSSVPAVSSSPAPIASLPQVAPISLPDLSAPVAAEDSAPAPTPLQLLLKQHQDQQQQFLDQLAQNRVERRSQSDRSTREQSEELMRKHQEELSQLQTSLEKLRSRSEQPAALTPATVLNSNMNYAASAPAAATPANTPFKAAQPELPSIAAPSTPASSFGAVPAAGGESIFNSARAQNIVASSISQLVAEEQARQQSEDLAARLAAAAAPLTRPADESYNTPEIEMNGSRNAAASIFGASALDAAQQDEEAQRAAYLQQRLKSFEDDMNRRQEENRLDSIAMDESRRKDEEDSRNPELMCLRVLFFETTPQGAPRRTCYRFFLPRKYATIMDLKSEIYADFGFTFSQQRLYYRFKELSDDDVLQHVPALTDYSLLMMFPAGQPSGAPTRVHRPQQKLIDLSELKTQFSTFGGSSFSEYPTYRNWNDELLFVQNRPRTSQQEILLAEKARNDLYQAFIESSLHSVELIVKNKIPPLNNRTDVNLEGVFGLGGLKFMVAGILIRNAANWQVAGEMLGDGELAFKAVGNELRALNYLSNHTPEGVLVPLSCVIDHFGNRFFCQAYAPISDDSLMYGSSTDGLTVFAEEEVLPTAHSIASVFNSKQHVMMDRLSIRPITLSLPYSVELHQQPQVQDVVYIQNAARLLAPDLAVSLFAPQVATFAARSSSLSFDDSSSRNRLPRVSVDRIELLTRVFRPEFSSDYGDLETMPPGWKHYSSLEPFLCDACNTPIREIDYYAYERRAFKCCKECFISTPEGLFKYPKVKMTLTSQPPHMRASYWKNDETGEISFRRPVLRIPLNSDAPFSSATPLPGASSAAASISRASSVATPSLGGSSRSALPLPFPASSSSSATPAIPSRPATALVKVVEDEDSSNAVGSVSGAQKSRQANGSTIVLDPENNSDIRELQTASLVLQEEIVGDFIMLLNRGTSLVITNGKQLTKEMHSRGINMRYLGRLAAECLHLYNRELCIREMIARSIKTLVRDDLSYLSTFTVPEAKEVVLRYLNELFNSSAQNHGLLWRYISDLVQKKFSFALTEENGQHAFTNKNDLAASSLTHSICQKLNVKLGRYSASGSSATFTYADITGLEPSVKPSGSNFKSRYVERLVEEAREYDLKGQRSLWYLQGGPERAKATAMYRDAITSSEFIYGVAEQDERVADLYLEYATHLESRHAEKGNPVNSRWNKCAGISEDSLSMEAREYYQKALAGYRTVYDEYHAGVAAALMGLARLNKDPLPNNIVISPSSSSSASPPRATYGSFAPSSSVSGSLASALGGMSVVSASLSSREQQVLAGMSGIGEEAGPDAPTYAPAQYVAKAAEITEKITGFLHPATSEVYLSLAHLYKEINEFQRASPFVRRAFVITASIFGLDDERTVDVFRAVQTVEMRMEDGLDHLPIDQLSMRIQEIESSSSQ